MGGGISAGVAGISGWWLGAQALSSTAVTKRGINFFILQKTLAKTLLYTLMEKIVKGAFLKNGFTIESSPLKHLRYLFFVKLC